MVSSFLPNQFLTPYARPAQPHLPALRPTQRLRRRPHRAARYRLLVPADAVQSGLAGAGAGRPAQPGLPVPALRQCAADKAGILTRGDSTSGHTRQFC